MQPHSVDFFQDGRTFATGSDDSSCRLWDTRSYRELRKFQDAPEGEVPIMCGVTSISASKSGRILFAAYDDWSELTLSRGLDGADFARSGEQLHA